MPEMQSEPKPSEDKHFRLSQCCFNCRLFMPIDAAEHETGEQGYYCLWDGVNTESQKVCDHFEFLTTTTARVGC